jgi:hypothetical protein
MILPLLLLGLLPQFHSPFCEDHRTRGTDGIRAVDFCNFSYPGIKSGQRKRMGWPNPRIRLKDGVRPPEDEFGSGLITLEQIQYADVTRDGQDDAMVTMVWHSGGTMQIGMVYVWTMHGSVPAVLWDFAGGDRGFGGLRRVYAKDGDLILELYDPDAAAGNCCSRRIIRKRFRWNGSRFVQWGKSQVAPNPDYTE